MTPETRAARDQLAAFLALPEYASDDIRVLGLCRTGQSHYDAPVTTGELRLVLAALDETARPCSHTWNGRIDTSEGGAAIHLSGFSGDGKLLAAHARARDLADDLGNALDEQQAQADARTEGWA